MNVVSRAVKPRSIVARALVAGGIVVIGFAASGCSSVRQAVGMEKTTPDEFRVVARAPLSMPPHYGLKAPRPGATRPQEIKIPDKARQIVIDGNATRKNNAALDERFRGRPAGELALLKRAGSDNIDPNIRRVLGRESTNLASVQRGFAEKLIFWKEPPPKGVVVDPKLESRRLRENAALGRPVTTGETPVIKRKEGGLFGNITGGILNNLF
ncbi:MAG: DUF3035 domain-containing protein [Alphaproteobacteria bacterium]